MTRIPEYRGLLASLKLKTQSLQNPLIKECTLNYSRNPNMVYGSFLKLRGLEVSKNCDARRVQGAALEPAVGELCWQSEKPAFNILLPRFLNVYYSFYYHYYY